MRKIGRNTPCTCGSGKRYKKCCGSSLNRLPMQASAQDAPGFQFTQVGLPGQRQHMVFIAQFKGNDPRNTIPPQGSPGEYTVTFILGKPGYNLTPEANYAFSNKLTGDSHLAICKPAFEPPGSPDAREIRIYGTTQDGEFRFSGYPNPQGFLSKLVSSPFAANTFHEAEQKAYRALAPSLSNWSVHLDIPLEIYQVESTEVKSGSIQMSMTTPYLKVPFAVAPTAELKIEFRGYASLYREALNSTSAVYQYLCFFKIIEGIQARRTRLKREAKKINQAFSRPIRVLPIEKSDMIAWLNALFAVRPNWDDLSLSSIFPPEVRGKDITEIIENLLKPLRVNIAHALTATSGELTLSVDELLHIQNVGKWLYLTKCIVRRMLKDEFSGEYLSYLGEDDIVRS